jgi:hypothetical protein
MYDVYRTDILRQGDVVIDLGASIGEFTIIASKKVGNSGVVIAVEPNPYAYRILEQNISRNSCHNILPINKGVAGQGVEKELSFWGINFKTQLDTLQSIVDQAGLHKNINFLKIDIEGYEAEVIRRDINIVRHADIISLELHDSSIKCEVDSILAKYGFVFEPLTRKYCIKKLIKNTLFSHPTHFFRVSANTALRDPRVLSMRPNFATGSYMRKDSQRLGSL